MSAWTVWPAPVLRLGRLRVTRAYRWGLHTAMVLRGGGFWCGGAGMRGLERDGVSAPLHAPLGDAAISGAMLPSAALFRRLRIRNRRSILQHAVRSPSRQARLGGRANGRWCRAGRWHSGAGSVVMWCAGGVEWRPISMCPAVWCKSQASPVHGTWGLNGGSGWRVPAKSRSVRRAQWRVALVFWHLGSTAGAETVPLCRAAPSCTGIQSSFSGATRVRLWCCWLSLSSRSVVACGVCSVCVACGGCAVRLLRVGCAG